MSDRDDTIQCAECGEPFSPNPWADEFVCDDCREARGDFDHIDHPPLVGGHHERGSVG